jgi:hypothetical protein
MLGSWAHSLNHWLRRGPPRHYAGPEVPAIVLRLDNLVTEDETTWRARTPLARTYFLPTRPVPDPALTTLADQVRSGIFQVASRFPAADIGFPPQWQANPLRDDSWLANLQGLEWLTPLVHAHQADSAAGYLNAAANAIVDWITHSPFRGAPSRWSWDNHATAKRLRLFAWFWEHYRKSGDYTADFARLLLASVYQHAFYSLDSRNYQANSNHGLEAIGAMLSAALTFPMFSESANWANVAITRLRQWLQDNISPEGFHLEQSPAYHWFVLLRLAAIDSFLTANGRGLPCLTATADRAAAVWPHLLKPNGSIPTVGDSAPNAPRNWKELLQRHSERTLAPSALSSAAAADRNAGVFIGSPRAGYAIFRCGPGDVTDLHLLFRCSAFDSPHCHRDALSLTLYALGRDWLVDPGYLNYHEWDPRRHYLRSPRAHSLVLAANGDFPTAENGVVDWGRAEAGHYVTSFHALRRWKHERTMFVAGPREVRIRDHLQPAGRPVNWQQLFQVAPGLRIQIVSPAEARLLAPDGQRCIVQQSICGEWSIVQGQEKPFLQGWHSPRYGVWESRPTLIFRLPAGAAEVESRLLLSEPGPAGEH